MQSVDFDDLKALDKHFTALLKKFPEKRKEFHAQMTERLVREVGQQIFMSGLNDENGTVESWQGGRTGSGGGYSAVSAVIGKVGPDSPGAITNYLENGHRIRPPGPSHRSRVRVAYVNGYHFYKYTGELAQAIAANEAQKFVDEVSKMVEEGVA